MSDREFSDVLNEQLDSFSSPDVKGKLDLIHELRRDLQDAQDRVAEIQMGLRHAIEEYNVELAKSLRKRLPQISVNLSDGRCSAGYRSTNLSCKPDLEKQMWVFDGNPHGRRFMRQNGPALNLSNQIDPLVDAMVKYFGRYKSLR
ncbi:MAG: hypothetical protein ACXABY_16615 [Candidatus Thorarchaeota archaeon]